ncbi:MAG: hypothetical protein ACPLKP_02095 [Microgenomates group bacterium]
MSKKRKTRQQKIILSLKRQLVKQQVTPLKEKKVTPHQEEISFSKNKKLPEIKSKEENDNSIFFYDPSLVKKDLFKTLVISLAIFSLQIVLYLKLR